MPELLSDGTINWLGGMDTSRSPLSIDASQYAKGCNVIIPSSLSGLRVRFGLHCSRLLFDDDRTKQIYQKGIIQAEGSFESNGETYLMCLVNGYVLKFTKTLANGFYVENLNSNDKNANDMDCGWIITIPNGCIVNNGFDTPIHVTELKAKRLRTEDGDIGIGRMGVYLQNRLFYVGQSGKIIYASDFLQPTKITLEGTNITGFSCPDKEEIIVAIGKQKSVLGAAEGGNLIWSSSSDIYSVDVRGSRSDWASLQSKVGKVTETVPGFAAASSYSFESFNTNIYFRSHRYGIAELKQSEYQFVNLDSLSSQSIEAAYYLDNDTDWMLSKCYTRACNKRLYTTVAPERTAGGSIYWNGILSYHPQNLYSGSTSIPRRYESVFTGVRPWCLTVINNKSKDKLYVHSHDKDKINRLYLLNEDSDFDLDFNGNVVEINGFIETKAYTMGSPMMMKTVDSRFYRLNLIERSVKIKLFFRPDTQGPWTNMWQTDHLVCRTKIEDNVLVPESHKGQTRPFVNVSGEKVSPCYGLGNKYISMQYRLDFIGPINLEAVALTGQLVNNDRTVTPEEKCCKTLVYEYLPDYAYSITKELQ